MPAHVSLQDDLASHYALSSITSMWVCSYFVNGCMVFVESQLSSLAVDWSPLRSLEVREALKHVSCLVSVQSSFQGLQLFRSEQTVEHAKVHSSSFVPARFSLPWLTLGMKQYALCPHN